MTLIFNSNSFKYELEAVVKLFIPVKTFEFIYDDVNAKYSLDDDYCEITVDENFEFFDINVEVMIDGNGTDMSSVVIKSYDITKDEKSCELECAKLLFECLSSVFGFKPKWGILTGVRPVKRVNDLIERGYDYPHIYNELKSNFLVSEDKIEIAYKTAMAQSKALSDFDDRTFSLYVSIPFCPSRCSYCSFISQEADKNNSLIPEYVQKLCREIRYTGKKALESGLKLDTVYIGGGTPTTLEPAYLDAVMKAVSESFDLSSVREYTVEAGRADTIKEEKLRVIKENGADRISINPQTLNDDVLKAIGRKHTVKQFYDAYKLAESFGFKSINTDLIAGLTSDTFESFKATIDGILELAPQNITVHTLSIKRTASLKNESDRVLSNPVSFMVEYATKRLTEERYLPYYLYKQKNMLENLENIGWTKEGYECLYNIYIMEEVQTIIALGSGASSKIVKGNDIERIFNYKLPLEYINNFDKMLEKKDEIFELLRNVDNE